MRSYECAVIFRPTVAEDGLASGSQRFAEVIKREGGEITGLETWGKRRLAYEIAHHADGHYFFYKFRAETRTLDELTRQLRIDENVLRHLIVADELATGQEPTLEGELEFKRREVEVPEPEFEDEEGRGRGRGRRGGSRFGGGRDGRRGGRSDFAGGKEE